MTETNLLAYLAIHHRIDYISDLRIIQKCKHQFNIYVRKINPLKM